MLANGGVAQGAHSALASEASQCAMESNHSMKSPMLPKDHQAAVRRVLEAVPDQLEFRLAAEEHGPATDRVPNDEGVRADWDE